MIKIEVESTETTERNITPKNGGAPFTIYEQEAWAHLGGRYPERIVLGHRDRSQVLQPGQYQPDPSSFYVGRFNKLEFGLRVKPLQKSQAA